MALVAWTRATVAAALMAAALNGPVLAGTEAPKDLLPQEAYKGLVLVAVPPEAGARYDTSLLPEREGIANLRAAVELLYRESPFSAQALETLKRNGNVIVFYDSRYPEMKTNTSTLNVAAFFPEYFTKGLNGSGRTDFVVVIGRHGIKWPTRELAPVIVHELVGHGMQRLRGRLEYVRELDLECEAMLYMERYYQELGFDKKNEEMIRFRKALEDHWCSDFKRYMREKAPSLVKLWDVLDPDVRRLLAAFEVYVNDLRDRGVSGVAIDAAQRLRGDRVGKERGKPQGQAPAGVGE